LVESGTYLGAGSGSNEEIFGRRKKILEKGMQGGID